MNNIRDPRGDVCLWGEWKNLLAKMLGNWGWRYGNHITARLAQLQDTNNAVNPVLMQPKFPCDTSVLQALPPVTWGGLGL